MASLSLQHINKTYPNGFQAVKDFNLEIEDKEFIIFVGPSGCGKSTTLRMIAGLEEISGGTLKIGDKVMNDVEPKDRDIAMVFQNYALYPHMTVYDNMAFGLKLRKVPKDQIDKAVREAARILDLEKLLDGFRCESSSAQCCDGYQSGIIPAVHDALFYQLLDITLTGHHIGQVQLCEFDLLGRMRIFQFSYHPVI